MRHYAVLKLKMVEAARIALASKEAERQASTSLVQKLLQSLISQPAADSLNGYPGLRLCLRQHYQPLTLCCGNHRGLTL